MRLRRVLSSILTLSIGISVLSGCGSVQSQVDATHTKSLTLALRDGTYSDVIRSCLPAFEEQTGITCEVVNFSEDDLHNLLLDEGGRSSQYDLCMADASWTAQLYAEGVVADLSELGYSIDNDIIPATTAISYYGDHLYLVPYFGNVTVLLYNKDLIKSSGVDLNSDSSLADVMEVAKYAESIGKAGFLYRGDTENNLVVDFLPILLAYGGWVVDENNRPTVNTPVFVEAMNAYLNLIATGEAMDKSTLIASIENGEGAMAIGWPGWYTPTELSPANYCSISGKLDENSISYNANVYGIWMLGICGDSSKKEAAAQLLTYLMDKNVQKETIAIGGVPCRYSSLRDEAVLAQYPQYDAICDALQGGTYRPTLEKWPEFYTILGNAMRQIIDGEISVENGLNQAQKELENTIR
ncbi:MAG: extracellular solute-binding protein [Lachnospiraceae bacterium]|nr:extracellular solute-binding protein [Lachnospiraceae bacterium]